MYTGRHRRTSRRKAPVVLILLCVLLIGLGGFFIWRTLGEQPQNGGHDPGSVQDGQNDPGTQKPADGDGLPTPEHTTTASGVACTLTELGEDAVYSGELILVNNNIFYHFPQEQDLVSIFDNKSDSYFVRDMEVLLSPVALDALNRMMDDFREQGGSRTINVVAGYRTKEVQQHLFEQSAERNGQDHAEKFVAQPGGSEHHTGYVVDLSIFNSEDGTSRDYDGTGEYAWINENCQNYGYVVRYDAAKADLTGISDEPWHFRYVGVPHATEMAAQGLCLEEYIDYLKQFPFDGEHLTIHCESEKKDYEVWYCEGSKAYVPDSGEYWISGNNVDGIIVTCAR